jgi:SWI/SNF-related matrix-associated actin-dependent regulator 1 of chromatin subfamily A
MRTFRVEGNNLFIKFPFNKEIQNEIQKVAGSRWNPALTEWVIPLIEDNIDKTGDILDKYGFDEYDWTVKSSEQKIEYTDIDYAQIEGKLSMLDICYPPRDYQKQTIAYGLDKRRFINGLGMGLGKTYTSVLTVELDKAFPCLVITPASVKYNFAAEWNKYTGRDSISVIETKETKTRKNNWDADVVIINYDILGKLVDNGRRGMRNKVLKDLEFRFPELIGNKWKSIICDEAHFLRNNGTARSKAVAKIVKPIDMRMLLTGTPTSSRPEQIINLLKILGKFSDISPSWFHFVQRYCDAKQEFGRWNTKGCSNLIELNQKLRDECYIRFEKEDVLKELPPAIKSVLNVSISNGKEYNKARDEFVEYLSKSGKNVDFIGSEAAMMRLNSLRQLAIKGKMKAIEQYIKDWIEGSDEKLIIFGEHREPLIKLAEKFKGDLIIGGISSKKKFDIVNDFNSEGKQLLFASMAAAGTGVDHLQDNCSNMLIIELDWNPDVIDQTISRLHRSGQAYSTNVNFILDMNTIDKYLWDMNVSKEEVSTATNKGTVVGEDSMKNILKKFVDNLDSLK